MNQEIFSSTYVFLSFSTAQSQQPYSHMDMALKRDLHDRLQAITPEYGMTELSYSSFTRCCGYRASPLSAADSVEAVSALLDAAGGVRVEIEVEGEMLTLKETVNSMVDQLSTFASEVTRVALEVGTEGILGGQARVEGVQGTWADLTRNVNVSTRHLAQ